MKASIGPVHDASDLTTQHALEDSKSRNPASHLPGAEPLSPHDLPTPGSLKTIDSWRGDESIPTKVCFFKIR